MELVECSSEYWEFVRELRLDSRVISGFIKTDFITKEQQIKYMQLNSQYYRIALVECIPAGYVGVIDGDIRVCTHPDFQGKGVGKFMINECMKLWPEAYSKVKMDNSVSLALFKACGFKEKYIILERE